MRCAASVASGFMEETAAWVPRTTGRIWRTRACPYRHTDARSKQSEKAELHDRQLYRDRAVGFDRPGFFTCSK